jgi:peptidoglycan hydrolase-like protein with peptidoglycan-binding domain
MLRNGSRGAEVEQLQRDLGMTGDEIDGIFGPGTERAVRTFQQNSGIQVDGIVGPETRARIAQYAASGAEEPAAGAEEPAAGAETPNTDDLRAQRDQERADLRARYADTIDAGRERDAALAPGANDSSGAPRPTANPNRAAGSTAPSQLRLRQQVLPAIDQLLSQVTPGGR